MNVTVGSSEEMSFVPTVLMQFCSHVPEPLTRGDTYAGPYTMLAYALLAYAAYTCLPLALAAIKFVFNAVAPQVRPRVRLAKLAGVAHQLTESPCRGRARAARARMRVCLRVCWNSFM